MSSSNFGYASKRNSFPTRIWAAWRAWWRRLTPQRQDRFSVLAPLIAVILFLAAIVAAFGYLRLEEIEREQEAVQRDVEYAQQQLRLRLLERQEQLMRLAREVSNREIDPEDFQDRAEAMLGQYPELEALSWVDEKRRIRSSYSVASLANNPNRQTGSTLPQGETDANFRLAMDLKQAIYLQRTSTDGPSILQLLIPLNERNRFAGVLLAEYSVDGLYRYGIPAALTAKYAVSLLDAKGVRLAGTTVPNRNPAATLTPWASPINAYEVPVSPVGNGLIVKAQAYRTSLGVIGSGLFWLVMVLSSMTAWMLIANWRHMRRRVQAQNALLSETNFRRAMENSMLTGMRAMDMQGRITYVNAAFCQMTGWAETDLVGGAAPFPYWPEEDCEILTARLDDELQGRTTPGGIQMRVKRRDQSRFDARLYVSPLIDSKGTQTGWMTSMTDITEPNRVREQLSASYARFTTVLDALDAAISVGPIGTEELLFANKMYRQWFGAQSVGHMMLVAQAGVPARLVNDESLDTVDSFAGLPASEIADTDSERTELFVVDLDKWLEVRTRYLSWVDGRLAQMVIATDITQRRLAEQESAAQAERSQASSRLITMGEMASSVAHELNQPLTAINNYCNGLVSRIKSKQINEADLLGALDKTARQAQRAGQIIQRIRSFVKRSEPNRTLANVADMVGEAVELVNIEVRRRNVRLTHYVAARLPQLMVDPILIEQVLVNLMKNGAEAVDASQRPSARRSVVLRVVPKRMDDKAMVEFSVTDSGKGLAPEVMVRLYEAFFSTKAEGMGIGLSLCRSIIESHQGRLKGENIYNGNEITGCCFTFWLPVAETEKETASGAVTKLQPASVASSVQPISNPLICKKERA